ncbi:MAG: DUF4240 domain-containing protein [Hyalangium sp.]|uniref:DUF4240 domain-containing protein n=1 Tax=Hyalangium sp. TaxID=2028555 RepID=UPI00389A3C86
MDLERFWKIVESSRRGFDPGQVDGNMARQLEELKRLLRALPPPEVVGFRDRLLEQMDVAFQWDLWAAAYLIAGGCSDDGFTDFRGWLISMGRRVFEGAMADAESLADVADAPGIEDVFFEEFLYVPTRAYEESTGHQIPEYTGPLHDAPSGDKWSEEGSELRQKFPKLWEKYPHW